MFIQPKAISCTILGDFSAIESRIVAMLTWLFCPRCKQSATGKYLGKHACIRCGWTEGT